MKSGLRVRLPALVLVSEALFLALYAGFVTYDTDTDARMHVNGTNPQANALYREYPFFTDVQVMIFLGFGCLLAFLRHYGLGGLAFNFLLATFSIQWAILVQGFFRLPGSDGKIHLGVTGLLGAEFACAAVLISFGAVLGKTSPVQLLVMALVEVPVFGLAEWVVTMYLRINDTGGAILIHLFACYFGLGVTFMLYRPGLQQGHVKAGSSYSSDILALLGTLFLWVFWPSFNSAVASRGDDQHRAVLHTFLGLSASTLTAFALSSLLNKSGRLNLADLQNVTLAGGVTVGASVDMMVSPAAAYGLGVAGAVACILGYKYLSPFMAQRLHIQDQCGIHNLHGLTGLISSLAGIAAILLANEDTYGPSMYHTFSHRAPTEGDPKLLHLKSLIPCLQPGLGRSAEEQALYQLAALVATIAMAIVGGVITGLVLKAPILRMPSDENFYNDELYFEVPADYETMGAVRQPVSSEDTKV